MKPLTILLALANVLVFLLSGDPEGNGFAPASPTVGTAFSSMFVHADLSHLLGNVLFLLVFGTLVERELGSVRFFCLYMAAGVAGCLVHALVSPDTVVGASGAIFGVLAAAAMIRAWALPFVCVYLGFQLVGLFAPGLLGMEGMALGAHVGGFVAGFVMTRVVFSGKLQEVTS